ncbi:MarR family transcriptional regulator [Croceicoccus bisphenolivorans]|uniref:MarR family transcriptional regulator n=1 Tax=Croceicoccus bisphenolivorans TaxID=1783232 RepID=UPI00083746A8|nr:MarR family transcriptional regulator [Croceicoccus bisphenolivorans]
MVIKHDHPRYELAKKFLELRTARACYFDNNLFGEPAWDMLLDLYVSRHDQRAVSATSLCIASGAPQTTALRYVNLLTDAKLIVSRKSDHDGRVRIIELSEKALALLEDFLSRALKGSSGNNAAIPMRSDEPASPDRMVHVSDMASLFETFIRQNLGQSGGGILISSDETASMLQ